MNVKPVVSLMIDNHMSDNHVVHNHMFEYAIIVELFKNQLNCSLTTTLFNHHHLFHASLGIALTISALFLLLDLYNMTLLSSILDILDSCICHSTH